MRTAVYLLLALTATAASAAEVYRSTDAKGNVIYSDRPENETSRAVVVLTPHPTAPTRTATGCSPPSGHA